MMQILYDGEEVSVEVLMRYHRISREELNKKLSENTTELKLDDFTYVIRRNMRKRNQFRKEGSGRKRKYTDVRKVATDVVRYKYEIPIGVIRVYVNSEGKEYSAINLCTELDLEYGNFSKALFNVKSFILFGEKYSTKIKNQLYKLVHHEKEDIECITIKRVSQITNIHRGNAKDYMDNNWYSKHGYRLEYDEMK